VDQIKKEIRTYTYLGLILTIIVFLIYFLFNPFDSTAATNNQGWANFGAYVGGVASPLLSFIALVLISKALIIQLEEISTAQKAYQEQGDHLKGQMELLWNTHKIDRLESMANTARIMIEERLQKKAIGFEDLSLEQLISKLTTRAGALSILNKKQPLTTIIDAEIQDLEDGAIPTNEKPSVKAGVIVFDQIMKLAFSLNDFERAISKICKLDLDTLDNKADTNGYYYGQTQPFKSLALDLALIGIFSEKSIENWGVNQNPLYKTRGAVVTLQEGRFQA